jgi:hypothetical protein
MARVRRRWLRLPGTLDVTASSLALSPRVSSTACFKPGRCCRPISLGVKAILNGRLSGSLWRSYRHPSHLSRRRAWQQLQHPWAQRAPSLTRLRRQVYGLWRQHLSQRRQPSNRHLRVQPRRRVLLHRQTQPKSARTVPPNAPLPASDRAEAASGVACSGPPLPRSSRSR